MVSEKCDEMRRRQRCEVPARLRPIPARAVVQRKWNRCKTHQRVQLAVFRGPADRRGLVRRDFRLDGGSHVNAVVSAEVDVNLTYRGPYRCLLPDSLNSNGYLIAGMVKKAWARSCMNSPSGQSQLGR